MNIRHKAQKGQALIETALVISVLRLNIFKIIANWV